TDRERSADLAVQLEQCRDRLQGSPAPAALGRDAEVPDEAKRRLDSSLSAFSAIREVHEPEEEVRLGPQSKIAKRLQVRLIIAPAGDRHVDPVERAIEAARQRVRKLHELARVLGRLELLQLGGAVAKVKAELGVRRDVPAEPQQALENARPDV